MNTKPRMIADVFVMILCGLVGCSILLVNVQRQRGLARSANCEENLKQLGLAIHNYHSAYNRMPMGSGGTSAGGIEQPSIGNSNRLSGFVGLTPFHENQILWEQIANPLRVGNQVFPPMGPVPWFDPAVYSPWASRPKLHVCPSDPDADKFMTASSYVMNYGDGIFNVGSPFGTQMDAYSKDTTAKRGAWMRGRALGFRDFLDGMSNTLILAESRIAGPLVSKGISGLPQDPTRCIVASEEQQVEHWPAGRGACWADGSLRSVGFQTILPPGMPSATSDKGELEAVMTASSHHPDGTHVLFADGHVRFVVSSIDAGDRRSPSVGPREATGLLPAGAPSPYGLWGALGTIATHEVVDTSDPAITEPMREWSDDEKAAIQKLPLETWTVTNDNTTFRARMIAVDKRSQVILLKESGEMKRVSLSSLKSEDAYRAVQTNIARKVERSGLLLEQLTGAVELLEKKQFQRFVQDYVAIDTSSKDLNQALLSEVVEQRGYLIGALDAAIRELSKPQGLSNVNFSDSGAQVDFRVRGLGMQTLKLQFIDGHWKLTR